MTETRANTSSTTGSPGVERSKKLHSRRESRAMSFLAESIHDNVGVICQGLPEFVYAPPVETVTFGWGVNEDGQLVRFSCKCLMTPCQDWVVLKTCTL
jgi:hypothetical protein